MYIIHQSLSGLCSAVPGTQSGEYIHVFCLEAEIRKLRELLPPIQIVRHAPASPRPMFEPSCRVQAAICRISTAPPPGSGNKDNERQPVQVQILQCKTSRVGVVKRIIDKMRLRRLMISDGVYLSFVVGFLSRFFAAEEIQQTSEARESDRVRQRIHSCLWEAVLKKRPRWDSRV